MEIIDILDKLAGKSVGLLNDWSSPSKIKFFKPLQSYSDTAFRAASVVTAPFVFALMAALFSFLTTIALLSTLYSVATFNFRATQHALMEILNNGTMVLGLLLIGFVSPVINVVDTLGGSISSLMEVSASSKIPHETELSEIPQISTN